MLKSFLLNARLLTANAEYVCRLRRITLLTFSMSQRRVDHLKSRMKSQKVAPFALISVITAPNLNMFLILAPDYLPNT